MATFVLVHGGGHGGWCYQCVAPLLRAAGHDVHTPTLTGLGDRAHLAYADVDLALHVQDVVAFLEAEEITRPRLKKIFFSTAFLVTISVPVFCPRLSHWSRSPGSIVLRFPETPMRGV